MNARNGQSLRELCAGLDMARQSVSKHLAVLEAANLVTTVRRGREKLHYLNAEPINDIAERWISEYDRERVQALADLKTSTGGEPDGQARVRLHDLHQHHPGTTLAGADRTGLHQRYWRTTFEIGLEGGVGHDLGQPRRRRSPIPDQVVLESEPYRRLSYTWHTFTPELGRAPRLQDEEFLAKVAGERRSKVTFEIEPVGQMVKLTVVHDDFEPAAPWRRWSAAAGRRSWPSLKTLLETGESVLV